MRLTVADVARELKISRQAVHKAIRAGKLRAVELLPGRFGITLKALDDYRKKRNGTRA